MGKWAQVKCDCPNRIPLPYNTWHQDPRTLHKRVTPFQREKWRNEVFGKFECGHENGMIFEFWQGDLMQISYALKTAFASDSERFEIFNKIINISEYFDETLFLSPEEAELLKLEIEEIQNLAKIQGATCWKEWQIFVREIENTYFLDGDFNKTLQDGLNLCEASIKTGNPIELEL